MCQFLTNVSQFLPLSLLKHHSSPWHPLLFLGLEKTLALFLQFIIHTVFRETTLNYILYLLYLQRYFLSPARSTCTSHGAAIPPLLQWLFQPKGHRFFVSGKWSCNGRPGMWASICSQGKLCTHKVFFLIFIFCQNWTQIDRTKEHHSVQFEKWCALGRLQLHTWTGNFTENNSWIRLHYT